MTTLLPWPAGSYDLLDISGRMIASTVVSHDGELRFTVPVAAVVGSVEVSGTPIWSGRRSVAVQAGDSFAVPTPQIMDA